MATSTLHVVSKHDNTRTATCQLPTTTPPPPLAPSSVRVRASTLSLASNNLSYARGGALLHWWSAYPVPSAAPAPYNSAADWGVVPAWGHAKVLDSTIASIAPGSTLWGFWPASGHPVDLLLGAADAPDGHWIERSAHRGKLMSLYNRYVQLPPRALEAADAHAAVAFKPVWEAGYLANRFVFPCEKSIAPVHPLGLGEEWSEADADLSAAVVVSLSAASTTGRSFAWQLARNRDGAAGGPRALLQVSSAPDSLAVHEDTKLSIRNVAYAEAASADTVAWIAGFAPRRVVVMDFGADEKVTEGLLAALSAPGAFKEKPAVAVVAVGWEPKVYSDAEMQARHAAKRDLGMVQFNASGIKDRAMEAVGPAVYFRDVAEAWERCCREAGLGHLEILYRDGVEGQQGIEGAWRDLCDRKVPPNKVMVVRLPLD